MTKFNIYLDFLLNTVYIFFIILISIILFYKKFIFLKQKLCFKIEKIKAYHVFVCFTLTFEVTTEVKFFNKVCI